MIQKGADITQRDSVRFSLTLFFMFVFYYIFQHVICIKVSVDIFKFMIQKGADITQRDSVRFSLTLFMCVLYYIFEYVICIKVSLFCLYV